MVLASNTGIDVRFNPEIGSCTWYFSQTAPGSHNCDQVDFIEVLAHELGHGLGLQHVSNTGSIMHGYPYGGYGDRTGSVRGLSDGDEAGRVHQHPVQTLSGTLGHSLVLPGSAWSGFSEYEVSGTFTVSNEYIEFEDGTRLEVDGTLNATGTTFDFGSPSSSPQNGIFFNSGSLTGCDILNAYYGVNCTSVLPTIDGCSITNNTTGIYLSSVNSTSERITDNNIYGNTSYGIACNYSTVRIADNSMAGNGTANIYCNNSDPWIYGNYVINSDYGVLLVSDSPAELYQYGGGNGLNFLAGNDIGVYAANAGCDAYAQGNDILRVAGTDYAISANGDVTVVAQYTITDSIRRTLMTSMPQMAPRLFICREAPAPIQNIACLHLRKLQA
jgi:hypothetical protein